MLKTKHCKNIYKYNNIDRNVAYFISRKTEKANITKENTKILRAVLIKRIVIRNKVRSMMNKMVGYNVY